MNFYSVILFFNLLTVEILGGNGDQIITIWEHSNYEGVSENLSVSQCSNIRHPNLVNLVSSTNLHGHCARLYDQFNCVGEAKDVLPNSPSHHHMDTWEMGDRIRSVGPCRNECDINVTGSYHGEDIEVQLFSKRNYEGQDGTVIGGGCMSLPNNHINNVESIKTFGQCIQLYNIPNCLNNGTNKKSIELRQDTYFHNDLAQWNFIRVKSMSHCRYKCDKHIKQENVPEVTMFDQDNYAGSWLKVQIYNCINLPTEWKSKIKSLELNNGTFAGIYYDWNCEGDPFVVKFNIKRLPATHRSLSIRSIRYWTEPKPQNNTSNEGSLILVILSLVISVFIVILVLRFAKIKCFCSMNWENGSILKYNNEEMKHLGQSYEERQTEKQENVRNTRKEDKAGETVDILF